MQEDQEVDDKTTNIDEQFDVKRSQFEGSDTLAKPCANFNE